MCLLLEIVCYVFANRLCLVLTLLYMYSFASAVSKGPALWVYMFCILDLLD